MREARTVALSLLVLVGALAVSTPATVAGPADSPGVADSTEVDAAVAAPAANNSSMGGQVSAFMHSASGQTGEEVESGMWNAAYENASNRSAVVEGRTSDILSRLGTLQEQKEALITARENGEISETEYRSRMSTVVGRMAALNRSIDETDRQARESGANASTVDRLRTQASSMTGPEVAATARSLAGGPPEGVPARANATGPPDRAGPPNGSEGPPGNGNGQGPPGNDSDQGPPDHSGGQGPPGNGNGPGPPGDDGDQGPPGNGNGQGPPDDSGSQGQPGNGNGQGQPDNDRKNAGDGARGG